MKFDEMLNVLPKDFKLIYKGHETDNISVSDWIIINDGNSHISDKDFSEKITLTLPKENKILNVYSFITSSTESEEIYLNWTIDTVENRAVLPEIYLNSGDELWISVANIYSEPEKSNLNPYFYFKAIGIKGFKLDNHIDFLSPSEYNFINIFVYFRGTEIYLYLFQSTLIYSLGQYIIFKGWSKNLAFLTFYSTLNFIVAISSAECIYHFSFRDPDSIEFNILILALSTSYYTYLIIKYLKLKSAK